MMKYNKQDTNIRSPSWCKRYTQGELSMVSQTYSCV